VIDDVQTVFIKFGGKDFFLSFDTDFVEKDVAAVTEQLVVVHDEVV